MSAGIEVRTYHGDAWQRFLPEIARLRIQVFRAFPYLYDGTEDYEARYLSTYLESEAFAVAIAFDGARVVGASTCLPMAEESEAFKRPFVARGIDPDGVFYLAESVLEPAYRGRGVGVRFFEAREHFGRGLGHFDLFAFCAVDRGEQHPARPAGYVPLDRFWHKRGYRRRPELATEYRWKDVGEAQETAKRMVFWTKPLATAGDP